MDIPEIKIMDEKEIKRLQEEQKKKDMLAKININQLPGMMPDHHIKGLQMMENADNDARFTEWDDDNQKICAVQMQLLGEHFKDDVRMRLVELLEEKNISNKRKGRAELMEATKAAAVGEFSPEGEAKKPGLIEKIKGRF